jgi:small-conductance mechanosensitive channel
MDLEGIFSPLSKEYCIWFYYLQMIGFIFLVLILLLSLFTMTSGKPKKDMMFGLFMMIITYVVFYFQNRLLYSMCVKSM